jgi:hypothetical protein
MRSNVLRRLSAARRAAVLHHELKQLSVIDRSAGGCVPLWDTPPQTYSEFLIRTQRRPLRHEPSASDRLAGHPVR